MSTRSVTRKKQQQQQQCTSSSSSMCSSNIWQQQQRGSSNISSKSPGVLEPTARTTIATKVQQVNISSSNISHTSSINPSKSRLLVAAMPWFLWRN